MVIQLDNDPASVFEAWRKMQGEGFGQVFGQYFPGAPETMPEPTDFQHWMLVAAKLQKMLLEFQAERMALGEPGTAHLLDPKHWADFVARWSKRMPLGEPEVQTKLFEDGVQLWQTVLGQYGIGPLAGKVDAAARLPREDRRFADPKWREHPAFALIHQTYLMLAEEMMLLAEKVTGLAPAQREKLKFATRTIVEAASPANFPLTNPLVLERTLATKGDNLVKGMEHLLADLRKGQLTHTDPEAFVVGRDIATTPGKVVHETELYQLIQYAPTTPEVLGVPLVIFPPWINRFYILDLNEKKSFVRWAVAQGITVFMVSWRSADASLRHVVWDDYVAAQIDAIEHVRDRLKVPAVHAVGYCVAGTTLAATLALLARRGEADKVRSATLFTAQVDFELAGELRLLVDERQLASMEDLAASDGYLDGRYMAATFNLLRSPDLIWQYVITNYLLGEDYPAFDLLHWNGDTTNLPWPWLKAYLTDLYRDNRLVEPDSLRVDGTPLDLTRIETPLYVQAGREDHIAPPESVWRITRHARGPLRFVLAGSGHIAGVVNPPAAGKYQYWTNPEKVGSLDQFVAGAVETKGSWWPDWLAWLRELDPATVRASGRRNPGQRGDAVIEDAPGRYVVTR